MRKDPQGITVLGIFLGLGIVAPLFGQEAQPAVRTLTGHANLVYAVAVSPDGRTVASGAGGSGGMPPGELKLWDVATGTMKGTLTGHRSAVWSVAFSPDGKTLASGGGDSYVGFWDVTTGTLKGSLTAHQGAVTSVAFSPDGKILLSGGADSMVRLWDAQTGQLQQTLAGHHGWIRSVAYSPDGKRVASASGFLQDAGEVRLWDAQTGQLQHTLQHEQGVQAVAFSPDGNTVATGSWDNAVYLWDTQTGQLLRTLTGHREGVSAVAFSPDGQTLASGSWDRTIKLWDVPTGELKRTLEGHGHYVYSIAFSLNGKMLVSGSWDQTVRLWDVSGLGEFTSVSQVGLPSTEAPTPGQQGQMELEPPPNHGGFFAFAFSPDGKTVAGGTGVVALTAGGETTKFGGEVVLWDAQTGKLKQTLGGHGETVNWLAYSQDGQTLASASTLNQLAYSQDGQTLASASEDQGMVKLWDTSTGQLQQTVTLQGKVASSIDGFWPLLVLSPDGHTLVTVQEKAIKMGQVDILEGGPLVAWDTRTGKEKWTVPDSQVVALALSPDGKTLAGHVAKSNWELLPDGRIKGKMSGSRIAFWDAQTGQAQGTLDLGLHAPTAMAFLPDSQTLATLDSEGLALWNWKTGKVQREIPWNRERSGFSSFAFSADGKTLARAWMRWVELLDVPTGKVQRVLTTQFPDSWDHVAFSPDLKRIAYSSLPRGWIRNLTGIK